ncbi:MAG: hydantoinase/oxoprolinase family protein [Candidatus Sericytochromatia bacterium]|nr:hydantoinase/oxoprolinase family protein [Candidatus Sericytochromatia bacterium]
MSERPGWLARLQDLFFRPGTGDLRAPAEDRTPGTRIPIEEPGRKVRVGIDVGGTFTHAVALDAENLGILASCKVPTTHRAPEGVAAGIVEGLGRLLAEGGIHPSRIVLIAHSTTQATNALLEGDVAPVGILAMASGFDRGMTKRATRLGRMPLGGGQFLETHHAFLDLSNGLVSHEVDLAVQRLQAAGARAFAVSAAFGVDDVAAEQAVVAMLRERGLHACAGHEISQRYGLRARTRTAVLNAAMLPRMVETADMTEASVRSAGITAPLMVMRSDGGVMAVDEMRKRPILTMLSGPAAGVAAAMMHVRLTDGIFLEVGGTSTDISVIRNGKAQVRSAELGGHRLYLRTLDVRTLGVAGGSMIRTQGGRITRVGPRSAHIAGLAYAAFPNADMRMAEVVRHQPLPGDPEDYVALRTGDQVVHTFTNTCAANVLGLVPPGDAAAGAVEQARQAALRIGQGLGLSPEEVADRVQRLSAEMVVPVVRRLMADYKLDPRLATLVGGGGGASAIVPYVARVLGLPFVVADHADVISAIGVALALVRETIERTVLDPKPEDLLRIRREAEEAVQKLGAAAGTIEVHLEVDPQRNLVRAIATGATELRTRDLVGAERPQAERLAVAARSLGVGEKELRSLATTEAHEVLGATREVARFAGFWRERRLGLRVMDFEGVIRLQTNHGAVESTRHGELGPALKQFLETRARYGDGGKEIPDVFLLAGRRIVDLSGLSSAEQVVSLGLAELEGLPPEAPIVLVGALR